MSQYRGFGGGGDDLPDPRVLLEQLKRNLRYILGGVAVVIVIGLALGSFFTVQPEERAVVLRFGDPIDREFEPGLHFKVPIVDQVHIQPVERQHRIEIGFRSEPGKNTKVHEQGYSRESLMLTGDLSLAHVRWSVLYKIKNLKHYLFNVKDPEENVRDVAKGVMRNIIGDYSLDEVLLGKYQEIAQQAKQKTQAALDKVQSGVEITNIELQKSEVPTEAKKAFDELNASVSRVKREIVEAYARRKRIRGEAKRERQTVIGEAVGRSRQIVQNARGEAAAFDAKLTQFRLAPDITRQWLYMETMTTVMGEVKEKIILDGDSSDGIVKLLPLSDLLGQALPKAVVKKAPPQPVQKTTKPAAVRSGGAR